MEAALIDWSKIETGIESPSDSDPETVVEIPSLIDLCLRELKNRLLHQEDYDVEDVCDIPPHLFELLVMRLPAAALENFEEQCKVNRGSDSQEDSGESSGEVKKRKRSGIFNDAWKALCKERFTVPEMVYELVSDWQQVYWQWHIQDCLDFATEQFFQPSYKGPMSQMHLSVEILKHIGYSGTSSPSMSDSVNMTLSYHCQRYGHYARSLKVRNVICTLETCDLLKNCELKSLILRRIRNECEVDALCKLLEQNIKSLRSITFFGSALSSRDLEHIFHSLYFKELGAHLLQDLCIAHSVFPDPTGIEPFLLGRSLRSVSISSNMLNKDFVERVVGTLLNHSASIEVLDLSENNNSGWFSGLKQTTPLSTVAHKSLTSLRLLSLRGNNMGKADIDDLNYALNFLPNLDALNLSENPVKDEGIGIFISCISEMAERKSYLKHLKLDDCQLSCDGAAQLLETLSSLERPLESLSIGDNNLGSGIVEPLGKFLRTCVRDLNIEDIDLGASGFGELEREITEELKLERINISKNRGRAATSRFVLKLISKAPALQTIEASNNLMCVDSVLEVCSALKRTKGNIALVDLTGNTYHPALQRAAEDFKPRGSPKVMLPQFSGASFHHDDDP